MFWVIAVLETESRLCRAMGLDLVNVYTMWRLDARQRPKGQEHSGSVAVSITRSLTYTFARSFQFECERF